MSRNTQTDQRGVVSIFVTMIMMLVISLIVIGFSQVARRNQRESLDRQLSTQAYYAAESGVNAATTYFAGHAGTPIDTLSTSNCNDATITKPAFDASSGVSVTCLMVDASPASLAANPVGQDSNVVWNVQSGDSGSPAFNNLTFTWNSNSSYVKTNAWNTTTNACGNTGKFPAYTDWNCGFGILRVDLVDVSGGISQATLENNANVHTIYMVPGNLNATTSPTPKSVAITSAATIVRPTCSTQAGQCLVRITGINGSFSSQYYARITTIYQDSDSVVLTAGTGSGAHAVSGATFSAGQAIIDATGKDQDELRRVQVRIPLTRQESTLPIFAVQSTDTICKNFTAAPGIYNANVCN